MPLSRNAIRRGPHITTSTPVLDNTWQPPQEAGAGALSSPPEGDLQM